jgi:hypothetical protein
MKAAATFTVQVPPGRPKHGHKRPSKLRRITYGTASSSFMRGGKITVTIKLGRRGRGYLIPVHGLRLTLRLTFSPVGAAPRTQSYPLRVKRRRKGRIT